MAKTCAVAWKYLLYMLRNNKHFSDPYDRWILGTFGPILSFFTQLNKHNTSHTQTIAQVLNKLLAVGITDSGEWMDIIIADPVSHTSSIKLKELR